MRNIYKKNRIALIITTAIFGIAFVVYMSLPAKADPVTYYFNNTISTNPADLGNYWYDAGFTDPALNLPNFSVDEVFVTSGATFAGNITFNLNARNDGTVQGNAIFNDTSLNANLITGDATFNDTTRNDTGTTVQGDATFYDSAVNGGSIEGNAFFHDASLTDTEGTIDGNATFYNDSSETQGDSRNSRIRGALTRHYTVSTTTSRDFSPLTLPEPYVGDGQQPWTVIADGVDVDVQSATFDGTVTFTEINGGNFIFPAATTFYFNNAVDTSPTTLGNYWQNPEANIPAVGLPNFVYDVVNILPAGFSAAPIFDGNITFNGSATNQGVVTGNAVFNDTSENLLGLTSGGVVQGNATFNNQSVNSSDVEGNATFVGDQSEHNGGSIGGILKRHYIGTITTTRNFLTNGPWTVLSDGGVVTVTGATYDENTRFEVQNGGSFIGAEVSVARYYFNNEINDSPAELGNYWLNSNCSIAAGELPDFQTDEVFIPAAGGSCGNGEPNGAFVFDGNITFNGVATNQGIVTGNAIFNDSSENLTNGTGNGRIEGNATFNDQSTNNGIVAGNATFVGDAAEMGVGFGVSVIGTKTRHYIGAITTTRDFTTSSPWTVLADGGAVNITGATFNGTTTFTTSNGGSFVFPTPVLSTASINAKILTLTYDRALDENSVPAVGDYAVNVNGILISVLSADVSGSTVVLTLTLNDNASINDVVSISYTPGTVRVQSAYDVDAAALVNQAVTVTTSISLSGQANPMLALGSKVYVVSGGNTVRVIDAATQTVSATITVGVAPGGIFTVNDRIYVTNQTGNSVSVINPATDTVVATIPVGANPFGGAVVGSRLYVLNSVAGTVSVINALTNTVETTITVGATPRNAAIVGTKLYVTNLSGNSVSVINLLTNTVSATINVGTNPRSPIVAGTKLYVINTNSISVIDTTVDTVQSTIALAGNLQPSSIYGSKLYITNFTTDSVAVIPTTTDVVSATINVGDGPTTSYIIGSKLYIGNSNAGGVSVINLENDTVVDTLASGISPTSMASLGSTLYIGRNNTASVSIIDTAATSSLLPNLVSFSSATPNGNYTTGQSITISANFARALAGGSTMTVGLNSGSTVVLDSVSGGSLSGSYTVASGEFTPDLSVNSIISASITDLEAHNRSSYAVPKSAASLDSESISIVRNLGDAKNISIGTYATVASGQSPQQLSPLITLNGSEYFYVSNKADNTVTAVRKSDGAIIRVITVGSEPLGMATKSIGGVPYVYAANSGSNSVSVINALTNTVAATITVGSRPHSLEIVGNSMYVSNTNSNTVSVIDLNSNTVTNTISVGLNPRGLKALDSKIYVVNYGDINMSGRNVISIINTATDTVSEVILLPLGTAGSHGIAIDNRNLYVTNYISNTVTVIDADTKAIEATIAVAGGPRDIIAEGNIYVAAFDAGMIWVIDSNTNMETAIIGVGHSPAGMSASDNIIYFARSEDDSVSLLNLSTNTLSSAFSGSGSSSGGSGSIISGPAPQASNSQTPPAEQPAVENPSQSETPTPAAPESERPNTVIDQKLSDRLKGRLLLAVQDRGKIWYIDPTSGLRYRVTLQNVLSVFRGLSLGITNDNLEQIPEAPQSRFSALANRLKGRLLLQVQNRGVIWYVDMNGQRHFITITNVLDIFRKLSLGITNENLDKIKIGTLE